MRSRLSRRVVRFCLLLSPTNRVLLVCTDGFWANLTDEDITSALSTDAPLTPSLEMLARLAVQRGGLGSDNTTAALLRIKE